MYNLSICTCFYIEKRVKIESRGYVCSKNTEICKCSIYLTRKGNDYFLKIDLYDLCTKINTDIQKYSFLL